MDMDSRPKPPGPSATFPLNHGSTVRSPNDDFTTGPTALREQSSTHRPQGRPLVDEEPASPDGTDQVHGGLLPTWSGRDKDREGDDGLLHPVSRETTRSRWGSDSTSGLDSRSRKGSLFDNPEQHERLGPIQRQHIQSMEDLGRVKNRRKQGEEYLRSALSSTGTLATELTRRLDYTYYNLLERITSLNSTISSFQDLSDSASSLLSNFEQDTAGVDKEVRKQINDLKGFEPQIELADALEKRMNAGRQRVEDLGKRLETVRGQIDRWEQREEEWQSRVSRRLRIFWATIAAACAVLLLGLVIQNWHSLPPSSEWTRGTSSGLNKSTPLAPLSDSWSPVSEVHHAEGTTETSWYPSSLAERRESLRLAHPTGSDAEKQHAPHASSTETDPLRILDEL
ncbi:hypothetical protein N7468_000095 [Penicillium chermesinum]|uniref:Uncharacterized protein n=1 Tax=Penicillium chermesinum TaxID=63820 RepID=A0A9W9TYI3_9EURO|nr:uncharacterized protein N7468_000095 [Penicillium chermesinum]KAJ5248644.1 hypothetical protein N7468_000095 [Penicillium chermesinum]